jgi:hypothetical protein
MSDNRKLEKTYNTAGYYSVTAAINYEYCRKHEYDFVYYRPYLEDPNVINLYNCVDYNNFELRHAAWSKILCTLDLMKKGYDYVMFIDSDCIVKNFDFKMEDLIKSHEGKDLIFSNNAPWCSEKPCTGIYICKVGEYATHFLNAWYNVSIPHFNRNHAWEQEAMYTIYKNFDIALFDNENMFDEHEGQTFRHVCSHTNDQRLPYFKNFLENKKIDFMKNMNEIVTVDFNTAIDP